MRRILILLMLAVVFTSCEDGAHSGLKSAIDINKDITTGSWRLEVIHNGAVVPEPTRTTTTLNSDRLFGVKTEVVKYTKKGEEIVSVSQSTAEISTEDMAAIAKNMNNAKLLNHGDVETEEGCVGSMGGSIMFESNYKKNTFRIGACSDPEEISGLLNAMDVLAKKYIYKENGNGE